MKFVFLKCFSNINEKQLILSIVPLLRLRNIKNGDHFYTTSVDEAMAAVASKAYISESIATKVSTSESDCLLKPVYRLYNNKNDHFYTANLAEANGASGYVQEGIAFYCAANENACGATETFYRYYIGNDHFYTTNLQEGFNVVSGGGKYEGVLCYTWK